MYCTNILRHSRFAGMLVTLREKGTVEESKGRGGTARRRMEDSERQRIERGRVEQERKSVEERRLLKQRQEERYSKRPNCIAAWGPPRVDLRN